ncbi:hypothetical protein NXX23_26315 [Bacteroides ovatus]|nr:hypothetical protein [Bacteroides ovatus]
MKMVIVLLWNYCYGTVEKVGALSTLISDNVKFNITDLRIMGDINGDDIAIIREMGGTDVKG